MSKQPVRIGVIGYGYWGPNLVRNFFAHKQSTVDMVADLDRAKLHKLEETYPTIRTTRDPVELIESPDIDAVVIATPVSTHYELAKSVLLARKHVLIEKPITKTTTEAEDLIKLAEEQQTVVLVDHTFLYTGAVRRMKEVIDRNELGELFYFDSERINLGLLQQDVDVLWDLATHDLSILFYLFDEKPINVQAIGYRHVNSAQDEMATLNLGYASGFHAHIRVSWLSPVKMRLTMIAGSRKMIVYDDVEPSEKVRIYDKGIGLEINDEEVTTFKPIYRAGDVFIPELDRTEALEVETQHFLDCIQLGTKPLSGAEEGLEVVRVLEAAQGSLSSGNQVMPL